jgi:outer membrane lipoprotein-sorting protein
MFPQLKNILRLFLLIIPIASGLMAGCGGSSLQMVDFSGLPLMTATPEELVAGINQNASSLRGLKAKLKMGLQEHPDQETRRCSGMLIATSPPGAGLYLKGYKRLIPTFFTLVSDGDQFWFHLPREDVVYTGSVNFEWSRDDSLGLYLNARDLFRALFVGPVAAESSWDRQDDGTFYVITIYEAERPARKLWIERKGFNVVRETYYDTDGNAQLEIHRDKLADLGGRLYPSSIVLRDLISGSIVYLDFTSITLNPENVPAGAFQFRIPDDVEVKKIDTDEVEA